MGRLPAVKAAEISALDRILDRDVPSFRRVASKTPSFAHSAVASQEEAPEVVPPKAQEAAKLE